VYDVDGAEVVVAEDALSMLPLHAFEGIKKEPGEG
jgi:hypothetical protein